MMRPYWPGLAFFFGIALAAACITVMFASFAHNWVEWGAVGMFALLDGLMWLIAVGVWQDERRLCNLKVPK